MKPIERVRLLEAIASELQARMSTSDINALLRGLGIREGLKDAVQSKRVYSKEMLAGADDKLLIDLANDLELSAPKEENPSVSMEDNRTVFVIHGRNEALRVELFSFLRAAGLDPLEWSEAVGLTRQGAPYIGEVLDKAFEDASAVLVLLTPDDEVRLAPELVTTSDGEDEREVRRQPRPNVLFEAGMAFGRHAERTVLVSIGRPKAFSDVAGRHVIHLTNDVSRRMDLIGRLEAMGCPVRANERRDWLTTGDFSYSTPKRVERNELAETPDAEDDLSDEEIQVLSLVAEGREVYPMEVAERLNISEVAAEHHLDALEGRKYLCTSQVVGMEPTYLLDKKGRAFLVQNGLA